MSHRLAFQSILSVRLFLYHGAFLIARETLHSKPAVCLAFANLVATARVLDIHGTGDPAAIMLRIIDQH